MSATSWTLDPDTLHLAEASGRTSFTAEEFARQVWPPCPVCGTPIVVDAIPAPSWTDRDTVIAGRWRCRRGCDPRRP